MRAAGRAWAFGIGLAGLLAAQLFAVPAQAQPAPADCPLQTAPGRFPVRDRNAADPGGAGIAPAGFVAPRDIPVLHGVDVSKWQRSADFNRVKACGGSFAYVRLTAGRRPDLEIEYRSHWSAARAAGLILGPYHALTLIEPQGAWSQLSDAQKQDLLRRNLAAADEQATLFLERLKEVLLLEIRSGLATAPNAMGAPYMPIMLALSSRPQAQFTAADRTGFGEVYRQVACRWYEQVNADPAVRGQAMGFYTTAFIYREFELAKAGCDLASRPAWIGHHMINGDSERRETDAGAVAAIRAMCEAPGGNRCILQQYTAYGTFASYSDTEGLDLDRFYGDTAAMQRMLQLARR